jgi:cyanophycinase
MPMYHLVLLTALLGQEPHAPPSAAAPAEARGGHLVIAGGGDTLPEIAQKALSLAGGRQAHVLIVPQASTLRNAGELSMHVWHQSGAERVSVLDAADKQGALGQIKEADLIWIPGGSQSQLMGILKQQGLVDAIRRRFQQGATVGGTSAGAAVMSGSMLTGDSRTDCLTPDAVKLADGLGLWPDVIVDQHYLRRCRFNRLLSAVLAHPASVGVGIDECTAVVVSGRSFEVIGKSNVVVIDARKSEALASKDGDPEAAAGVSLHVLRAGMRFDLDKGLVPESIAQQGR